MYAYQFALADPYRAATHNKGIMNGIAGLALATGNDTRAIEAGAHAFASLQGIYSPLTDFYIDKQGNLVVIENKLDDSGKDVTWQVLKYASYCSGLSKENIRKSYQDFLDQSGSDDRAEDHLADFLDVDDYQELLLNKGVTHCNILL